MEDLAKYDELFQQERKFISYEYSSAHVNSLDYDDLVYGNGASHLTRSLSLTLTLTLDDLNPNVTPTLTLALDDDDLACTAAVPPTATRAVPHTAAGSRLAAAD
eukprot:4336307-Prymnesium_polylepis.1